MTKRCKFCGEEMKEVLRWNDRVDLECKKCGAYLIIKVCEKEKWISKREREKYEKQKIKGGC